MKNIQKQKVVDMADYKATIETIKGESFTLDTSKIPDTFKGRFRDKVKTKDGDWYIDTRFIDIKNIWGWQPEAKQSDKATNSIRLGDNINHEHISSQIIPSIEKWGLLENKYPPCVHYDPITVDGRTFDYQLSVVGNHTVHAVKECLLDPEDDVEDDNPTYRKGWIFDIYDGLPDVITSEEMGWESNDTAGNVVLGLNKASQTASLIRLMRVKYAPFCDGSGKNRELLSADTGALQKALKKFIRGKHTQSDSMTNGAVKDAILKSLDVELSHKDYTPKEAISHVENVLGAKVDFEYDSSVGEYGTVLQGKKGFIFEKYMKALQYFYESDNCSYAHIYVDTPRSGKSTDDLRIEALQMLEDVEKWIVRAAPLLQKGKRILKTKGFLSQNRKNNEPKDRAQTCVEVKERHRKAKNKVLGPF